MADTEKVVMGALRSMLRRKAGAGTAVSVDDDLYGDLGLDSLDVAEFSAELEDELGRDPYSEGVVPRTVGEVIEFYSE
jgi:acyl carrier protein